MPKSQIKLSHSHPCHDICDDLKGSYPKSFKWVGWYPSDLCYVVPIIKSEEKWWEYEDNRGNDNDVITDVQFIAHAAENYWQGNSFFKKIMPSLYEGMNELYKKWFRKK